MFLHLYRICLVPDPDLYLSSPYGSGSDFNYINTDPRIQICITGYKNPIFFYMGQEENPYSLK